MTREKLKIGILGCGKVARRHHLPVFLQDPRVSVVSLCDTSQEALDTVVERFGLACDCFLDPDEFFQRTEAGVIDICTPGITHFLLARQALTLGKHVLLEKPPVMKLDDALVLIALAKQNRVKIGTIFNNRYREVLSVLRQKVDQGLLGKIVKLNVLHQANLVYADSPWLWDERQSKYLVSEFGIHFFDYAVSLLGEHENILSVVPIYQERIGQTTEIQVTATFRSGTLAHFVISQDSTRHSTFKTEIDVCGTAMDAHVRFFPPLVRLSAGLENPLALVASEIKSMAHFLWLLVRRRWRAYQNQGHAVSLNLFVDWVMNGRDYPFALEKVLPTLRLLEDINRRIPSYAGTP